MLAAVPATGCRAPRDRSFGAWPAGLTDHSHAQLPLVRVVAEPYEMDGLTVIPAARVVGGGIGIVARLVGVYVIKDGEVRWVPATDVTRVIGTVGAVVIGGLLAAARLARTRARWDAGLGGSRGSSGCPLRTLRRRAARRAGPAHRGAPVAAHDFAKCARTASISFPIIASRPSTKSGAASSVTLNSRDHSMKLRVGSVVTGSTR